MKPINESVQHVLEELGVISERATVYRGLRNVDQRNQDWDQKDRLETWTENPKTASAYGDIISKAEMTMANRLDLSKEGAQLTVSHIAKKLGADPNKLLDWIVQRDSLIRDYNKDPDGHEDYAQNFDRDSLDPYKIDIVVFDLVDAPDFAQLLTNHGFDGISYIGWEGDGHEPEHRVISNDQLKVIE